MIPKKCETRCVRLVAQRQPTALPDTSLSGVYFLWVLGGSFRPEAVKALQIILVDYAVLHYQIERVLVIDDNIDVFQRIAVVEQ